MKHGEGLVYQDDGKTLDHLKKIQMLKVSYEFVGQQLSVRVDNVHGIDMKSIRIDVLNVFPIRHMDTYPVSYDAFNLVAFVHLPFLMRKTVVVEMGTVELINGNVKEKLQTLRTIKKSLDRVRISKILPDLTRATSAFLHWDHYAQTQRFSLFAAAIANFTAVEYPRASAAIRSIKHPWVVQARQDYLNKLLQRAEEVMVM